MTHDIDVLTQWLRAFLWVAAFFTTSFPVLWAFSKWNSTKTGVLLMCWVVAFALVLDVTVLFQYWTPKNILVIFWTELVMFALIAVTSAAMTIALWRANHSLHFRSKRNMGEHK